MTTSKHILLITEEVCHYSTKQIIPFDTKVQYLLHTKICNHNSFYHTSVFSGKFILFLFLDYKSLKTNLFITR